MRCEPLKVDGPGSGQARDRRSVERERGSAVRYVRLKPDPQQKEILWFEFSFVGSSSVERQGPIITIC